MNATSRLTALGLAACALVGTALDAHAQVSPELLSRYPEVYDVALSPNGKLVAVTAAQPDGMETQLQVVPLDGSGKSQLLRFGRQHHVIDVKWSDDDQLIMARARMQPLRARPVSFGELMSSDTTGKTQETLFAYLPDDGNRTGRRKDQCFATVVDILHEEPGKVLVDCTSWARPNEKQPTFIYKVDTRTGNRQLIEQYGDAATFQFDASHRARVRMHTDDNDEPVLFYRPGSAPDWRPMPKSLAGRTFDLIRMLPDGNTGYALISDAKEPAQLYKVDFAKATRTRLAGRDDMEIASVMTGGHERVPFGVIYNAGKPSIAYLDPSSPWAKLHAGLLKAFPGQLVSFRGFSRDDTKALIMVQGDRNPGAFYVVDTTTNQLQLINETRPWLKSAMLVPSIPVSFTTRDGLTLHGFYTAPATAGPRPLIVMPHGGPHGPYDTWGYESDAQFFATRGYGVLQINYRGSGGRGRQFEESGHREWGGKMQDDLADGVRWAIAQKLADPQRICTYGASYGGYAALMQPIRYPELYKCAIGYVGVYDLQVMKKKGDIPVAQSGKRYLERVLGADETVLKAWSPAQNVDKIKVPVFLVQGSVDRRVPMDQFNALKNAFERTGTPVDTMVAQGEGHGFVKPENRAELYRRIEAFLGKHIGPGAH